MSNQAHYIFIKDGPEPGKTYELSSVSVTIGRDPMVEITINDPEVSRKHARLIGTMSGYRIQDLGSTNGTFVDGIRLGGDPIDLKSGQTISIGSGVVLIYQDKNDSYSVPATVLTSGSIATEVLDPGDQPQFDSIDPIDEAEEIQSEKDSVNDFDATRIDSIADDYDDQTAGEDLFSQAAGLQAKPLEESPSPVQYDRHAREARSFSGAVVVAPHESEAGQPASTVMGTDSRRNRALIAALLLLVVCCGCSFLLFMYYYGGDWLLRQIGWLP